VVLERWAAGDAYEAYVGRWSRRVAAEFVAWLDAPAGGRWVDVGCGTGALATTALRASAPASVVGVDSSTAFLRVARAADPDPRLAFAGGSAMSLPLPDGVADVVTSGLVLNFVPDPSVAVAELARIAAPGGTVAAYVWDYAEGMEFMRRFWDAAAELDPASAELDEGRRFSVCRPDALRELWTASRLTGVEARGIEVPTDFADFDDLWQPFLGATGPGPTYVSTLADDHRDALRERLRTKVRGVR
jgi:SAM-dependent methyltransferase